MTRELAMVHAREGIRVNALCPCVARRRCLPDVLQRPVENTCGCLRAYRLIAAALLMDFLNTPEKRDRRLVHVPMGRFGEAIEQGA